MKRRLLITSLAVALPIFSVSAQVMDDDNVLGQDVQEERLEGSDIQREELHQLGKLFKEIPRHYPSNLDELMKQKLSAAQPMLNTKPNVE